MDEPLQALIRGLFGAGLFQLGTFTHERQKHVKLRLELLSSYPHLLRSIAGLIQQRLAANISRLVCTSEAVGLGTAVSLMSDIPLVCHTGKFDAPNRNFVGAYDIEHPAALLMLNTGRYSQDVLAQIYRDAGSVGLQIIQNICVIDDVPSTIQQNSTSLIRLADAVQLMSDEGLIPSALGQKALAEL